jgi:hypothetical protein
MTTRGCGSRWAGPNVKHDVSFFSIPKRRLLDERKKKAYFGLRISEMRDLMVKTNRLDGKAIEGSKNNFEAR